jgi:hypothetical protein
VEEEEGAEGSVSPLVATAMVAGVGRSGQATAAAIQSPEGRRGPERRVRGAGLGRFDRPRPEPGG